MPHPAGGVVEDSTAVATQHRFGFLEGPVTQWTEALSFAGQRHLAADEYLREGHGLQLGR